MNNQASLSVVHLPSPVKKVYIYDIDISNTEPKAITTTITSENGLNDFLIKISQNTLTDTNHKTFEFEENSYTKIVLNDLLKTDNSNTSEECSLKLAQKLLDVEIKATSKVLHLQGGLKKGAIVICHFKSTDRECLILSKLDFESFIDRETYTPKQGLPEKNGVLKSCVINITNGELNDCVYLLDSNKTIAKYWSCDFLETKQQVNDLVNTKNAFREISKTFKHVATKSKVDFYQLKDNMISYFSTNTCFTTSDLINSLIGDYKPVNESINLEEIKDKIIKLVKDKKFDGSFTIDDSEIKSKYRQKIKLDDGILITANQGFNDRIFKTEINGESYILIRTNTGLDSVISYPTEL